MRWPSVGFANAGRRLVVAADPPGEPRRTPSPAGDEERRQKRGIDAEPLRVLGDRRPCPRAGREERVVEGGEALVRRPRTPGGEGDEGKKEADVVCWEAVELGELPVDDADSAFLEGDQVRVT